MGSGTVIHNSDATIPEFHGISWAEVARVIHEGIGDDGDKWLAKGDSIALTVADEDETLPPWRIRIRLIPDGEAW